ncbi:MAG: PLDc_N domain-containing protein [Planctomycetes bacterium]|nr:PLDc_N domain-containing protein [Planctomycetota bacterium]
MPVLPVLVIGIAGLFSVGLIAFWIWMLVDCASNEPSTGNDKLIWILVIVLAGLLGALIYLIARRPQRKAQYGR